MERGALVAKHDVVGAWYPHYKIDTTRDQQAQQRVGIVLIRLGMVGVTDVNAHRHAHKLAAEMVLESGARDLLAIEQVFRPDKANDSVDQQRLKPARNSISARFER